MLFLIFSITASEELHQMISDIQTSSLLGLTKPSLPPPALQILWCCSINSANILIRSKCLSIVLFLFQHYSHTRFISNSQVLLWEQKPISILQTLKVYLAAIHLMHMENGFTDLTTDESLHLVYRGICRQQSTSECVWLPITINLMRTLKSQLRTSQISLLEQHLL